MKYLLVSSIFLLSAFLADLPLCAQDKQAVPFDTEFRVRLLVPLSSKTNKKGDRFSAQVLSPEEYKGDMVEGTVSKSKSSNKVKGKSELAFYFDTLHHAGRQSSIASDLKAVVNSQGIPDVDEEGNIVRKNNNLGKAAAAAGIGAIIGALAGGVDGAAIGAGIGGAVSLVLIKFTVKGPHISFAPGSEFILDVKSRSP